MDCSSGATVFPLALQGPRGAPIVAGMKVSPSASGAFAVAPRNVLLSLSLGNGSRFDVVLTDLDGGQDGPRAGGLCVAVFNLGGSRSGAYLFSGEPSVGYVMEKLHLLEGDAVPFTAFIAAQLG